MYSYKNRVSYSQLDKEGKLGVSNVVDAMQDCCLFHSEDIGHGALKLLEKNRAWLVSAWHIVFKRRPLLGERYTTYTWPYKFQGIWGCRNFCMRSQEDEVLAYADSRWFYFDNQSGKPAHIDAEEIEAYETEPAYDMEYGSRKVKCKLAPHSGAGSAGMRKLSGHQPSCKQRPVCADGCECASCGL